ncbi:2-oxoisovalerate dehydrogenase E2 component (dihydrolipoyl transacylase) [Phycisphaerales bacterium]|nr:2-oxoisovalerate dehydrogenase E2 component (dihydrolipoyl transacylase) [Phycisphaerales bacterium]
MAHATSKDPNVFLLPDLGEGLAEAELLKWRVEVGQHVNELEVLAEMETDKAVVEVTSPRTGTIAELHGNPGDIIKVGTPLVVYGGASAGGAAKPEPARAVASANGSHAEPKAAPRVDSIEEPPARTEDEGTVVGMMNAGTGKALATPAVRRLARDLGVDIDSVKGSGIGGRVLEKDVRACAGKGPSCGMGEPSIAPLPAGKAPRRGHVDVAPVDAEEPHSAVVEEAAPAPALRGRPSPSPVVPARTPAPSPRQTLPAPSGDEITRIPFRGVRRTIANRLRESMNQAVHFTVMDEADVSALDSLRRKLAAASGEKVSFLPFVASAVCRVLSDSRFRSLNATVDEKAGDENYAASIEQHRSVHLGIATDTDSGLMVPVIRDGDRLGVLELGRAIASIAESARNRTIPREQLLGSTFTISNVGSHAGRFATPVINYPEVGILAVGRGREGMVVNKGSFRVGLLLPLSLACDHRVVDGATAALALAEIIALLGRPEELMAPARG